MQKKFRSLTSQLNDLRKETKYFGYNLHDNNKYIIYGLTMI